MTSTTQSSLDNHSGVFAFDITVINGGSPSDNDGFDQSNPVVAVLVIAIRVVSLLRERSDGLIYVR